jgi:hypothetical protein
MNNIKQLNKIFYYLSFKKMKISQIHKTEIKTYFLFIDDIYHEGFVIFAKYKALLAKNEDICYISASHYLTKPIHKLLLQLEKIQVSSSKDS